MSTIATRQAPPEVAPAPAVPGGRRRWTRLILPTYTWLMIFYLSLPILVMIVFGFNDIRAASTCAGRASPCGGTGSCSPSPG